MSLPTIAGVQSRILTLPGRKPFMTSHDMAAFYEHTPKRVVEQTRRNIGRFPEGYIFEPTKAEMGVLIAQNAASNRVQHGTVMCYTKKGCLQLSSVLGGPNADRMAVLIIDTFDLIDSEERATLRRAAFKVEAAYIGRSAMKQAIKQAAAQGLSFAELWGWHDWSAYKLAQTVEEMRAMGFIPPHALFVPRYVFTDSRRKAEMALMETHAEDDRQERLGLEG